MYDQVDDLSGGSVVFELYLSGPHSIADSVETRIGLRAEDVEQPVNLQHIEPVHPWFEDYLSLASTHRWEDQAHENVLKRFDGCAACRVCVSTFDRGLVAICCCEPDASYY